MQAKAGQMAGPNFKQDFVIFNKLTFIPSFSKFHGQCRGFQLVIKMRCNAIQCNAMQCNAMQYNAMQCNAMQCNAMQCNAMQCNARLLICVLN